MKAMNVLMICVLILILIALSPIGELTPMQWERVTD